MRNWLYHEFFFYSYKGEICVYSLWINLLEIQKANNLLCRSSPPVRKGAVWTRSYSRNKGHKGEGVRCQPILSPSLKNMSQLLLLSVGICGWSKQRLAGCHFWFLKFEPLIVQYGISTRTLVLLVLYTTFAFRLRCITFFHVRFFFTWKRPQYYICPFLNKRK